MALPWKSAQLAALTLALAGCAFIPPTAVAGGTPCAYTGGYPGDSAPKPQLAAWMAAGAIRAGLPAELPVMAALPESELRNVPYGKDDSVGFFQMKLHIWNKGQYAGYLENPELQLKWFVDQALAVNQSRIADGQAPYGADSSQWGYWVADVEVPGANIGQYQSHLDEAHGLIVLGCGLPAGSGFPAPAATADSPEACGEAGSGSAQARTHRDRSRLPGGGLRRQGGRLHRGDPGLEGPPDQVSSAADSPGWQGEADAASETRRAASYQANSEETEAAQGKGRGDRDGCLGERRREATDDHAHA